jgi:hypothetical protein
MNVYKDNRSVLDDPKIPKIKRISNYDIRELRDVTEMTEQVTRQETRTIVSKTQTEQDDRREDSLLIVNR